MNIKVICVSASLIVAHTLNNYQTEIKFQEADLFDEAVELIKNHEGWHSAKHYPYVGYGHRLTGEDSFNHNISKKQADSILRSDLRKKCAVFREFGKDSLILGVLAYNVGEYSILGIGKKPKSRLLRKLESGNRNVYSEYISFRMYKGKVIKSIENRRIAEFKTLFDKTKLKTR